MLGRWGDYFFRLRARGDGRVGMWGWSSGGLTFRDGSYFYSHIKLSLVLRFRHSAGDLACM